MHSNLKQRIMKSVFIRTLLLFNFTILSALSATITVPATADPWLAGMPNGTTADGGDVAPAESPVLIPGRSLLADSRSPDIDS